MVSTGISSSVVEQGGSAYRDQALVRADCVAISLLAIDLAPSRPMNATAPCGSNRRTGRNLIPPANWHPWKVSATSREVHSVKGAGQGLRGPSGRTPRRPCRLCRRRHPRARWGSASYAAQAVCTQLQRGPIAESANDQLGAVHSPNRERSKKPDDAKRGSGEATDDARQRDSDERARRRVYGKTEQGRRARACHRADDLERRPVRSSPWHTKRRPELRTR